MQIEINQFMKVMQIHVSLARFFVPVADLFCNSNSNVNLKVSKQLEMRLKKAEQNCANNFFCAFFALFADPVSVTIVQLIQPQVFSHCFREKQFERQSWSSFSIFLAKENAGEFDISTRESGKRRVKRSSNEKVSFTTLAGFLVYIQDLWTYQTDHSLGGSFKINWLKVATLSFVTHENWPSKGLFSVIHI